MITGLEPFRLASRATFPWQGKEFMGDRNMILRPNIPSFGWVFAGAGNGDEAGDDLRRERAPPKQGADHDLKVETERKVPQVGYGGGIHRSIPWFEFSVESN